MKGLFLAFGASIGGLAGLAAGCGGNAFSTGDSGTGAAEAGVEAAAMEGRSEAGQDAAPPVDAGPSYCSGRTDTFCEDFDQYPNVNNLLGSSTWPSNEQQAGSFSFDTVNEASPPNSLEVAGDDGAEVIIVKNFPPLQTLPTKVTLAFDLRINTPGMPGLLAVAGFAAIAFGTSISDGYVALAITNGPQLSALWVQSTSVTALDAGTFKATPAMGAFPSVGVWAGTFAVEVEYDPPKPPCLQVYRGVTALLSSCVDLPPEFAMPTVLSIVLGDVAGGVGKTGTVNLEFDNVTFDVK